MLPSGALVEKISAAAEGLGEIRLMEVCGTHTMAIAAAGLKSLLPPNVKLLSGPGCPVCVTSAGQIDACMRLAQQKDVLLVSYGDMLRVPGSVRGQSLARMRALGAQVQVALSPMDAVALARDTPHKRVVFLAVGFETTAPGTAAAVQAGAALENFYVYSMLKRVEPALRALAAAPDFRVDGLLCPGHVASVLGEDGFAFTEEMGLPAVIAGFTPEDILLAVYLLLAQLRAGEARLENAYPRAVRKAGNPLARAAIDAVFASCDAYWRGLGEIPQSGLALREVFHAHDAGLWLAQGADVPNDGAEGPMGCRCGAVLRGAILPTACPLFGVCTPEDPVGPCMVSAEGACAAAYQYGES